MAKNPIGRKSRLSGFSFDFRNILSFSRQYFGVVLFSFSIGLAHSLGLRRLGEGSLIATFALMSDDSFDYVVEALAFASFIETGHFTELPVLRHPGLVIILTLDFFLASGTGSFWFFVSGLVTGLLSLGFLLAARSVSLPIFFPVTALAIILLSPTAHFRMWLLADHIGTSLLALSALSFSLFFLKNSEVLVTLSPRMLFNVGAFFGVAGGLFQTYSLLPLLVASVILVIQKSGILVYSGIWVSGYLAMQFAWRTLVPHGSRPANFSLIEPTLAMWPFYAITWSFLLPGLVALWLGVSRGKLGWTPVTYAWGTVGGFMVLLFFYQWQDMRLSMVLVSAAAAIGLIFMAAVFRSNASSAWVAGLFALVLATIMGLFIRPSSYWVPSTFAFDPMASAGLWSIGVEPVDRWGIVGTCGELKPWCAEMVMPDGISPYVSEILSYLATLVS